MEKLINKAYMHRISTNGLRNIKDIDLKLDAERPRHLMITGNNGVGKTTFVEELYKSLSYQNRTDDSTPLQVFNHIVKDRAELPFDDPKFVEEISNDFFLKNTIEKYPSKCKVILDSIESWELPALSSRGDFLVLYYPAARKQEFKTPEGPKKLSEKSASQEFIQTMVNLKTQAAYANLDGKEEIVRKISNWFSRLENSLSILLGHDDFKLVFESNDYNFTIEEGGKEPYHFTELSDGYSAILTMVGDIMLHMTTGPAEGYDIPGIVIIDELETHLHVALQKKILPFLTELFPRIQFVVTTHSPFILSSIQDSVVYDLGNKKEYRDLSGNSYSNLIEGYFDHSQYSESIVERLRDMERILSKEELTDEDKRLVMEFDRTIASISKIEPVELKNRWLDLKLRNHRKL